MLGLSNMIGAGLGILGGLTSKKPPKYREFKTMTSGDQRRGLMESGLNRTEAWASGRKPMMSQANINRLLSGQNARLEATAQGARARATERAIASGEGPRSGSRDRRMGEIDRSLLDAKRQQASPLMGQLAMAEPEFQMRAQGMLFPALSDQERIALGEHDKTEQARMARAAAGSQLQRTLAGGMTGFLGGGPLPWGGGGGAQQTNGGAQGGSFNWTSTPFDTGNGVGDIMDAGWEPNFEYMK